MSKPLKSTHAVAPLPAGWTEHRAPTGHLYYHNASTKQSTYKRPGIEPEKVETPQADVQVQDIHAPHHSLASKASFPSQNTGQNGPSNAFGYQRQTSLQTHRRLPEDRPKHKQLVPGAEPWLLIRTKLRRRFVYNPHTGESLWKFPADVMKCVIELDRTERERRERHKRGDFSDDEKEEEEEEKGAKIDDITTEVESKNERESDEYEEVEVSDEEEDGSSLKRPRMDDDDAREGPVEFVEDDIAYQLAQMEAQDGNSDSGQSQDALELSVEDMRALFADLLDDHKISPFTPWDSVVSEGHIIDDDRYTVLPNMRSRREAFDEWSKARIAEIKELREMQAKQDPLIPYMEFLSRKATPKLYWQEFRRKYQKEPEMKDRKLSDKDREKWYREHIQRLKLGESERKRDLKLLLEGLPVHDLNKSTRMDALPASLLRDIRYVSLPERTRNSLVEVFIATAAPFFVQDDSLDPVQEERRNKIKAERQRRERALADRERAVREQQDRERRDLSYSKGVLREGEVEMREAMRTGHDGLRSQLRDHLSSD